MLDYLWIYHSQLHPISWAFVKVSHYWYENNGWMGSTSKNIFLHVFFHKPSFKERPWSRVSFHFPEWWQYLPGLYWDLEKFKNLYFLTTHISLASHVEICTSSGSVSCTDRARSSGPWTSLRRSTILIIFHTTTSLMRRKPRRQSCFHFLIMW